jgi:hypothetical protein
MTLFKLFLLATLLLLGWGDRPPNSTRLVPSTVLPGTWGWEGSDDCAASPQALRFSKDRQHMLISLTPRDEHGQRAARRQASYRILGDLPNGLRLSLAGEKRLDAHGKPVTWDLIILDRDQYCWHRTDWPGTGCTKSVLRCEATDPGR